MSSAMWWTSRASPVSITRPTWVRVFSRTRWWWTAAVSSSDGIGAQSVGGVAVRQDDEVGPVGDGLGHPAPHVVDGPAQRLAAGRRGRAGRAGLAHLEEPVDGEGLEARRLAALVDVHQLGQVVAVDDRQRQQDLAARARPWPRAGCPRGRWWPTARSPAPRGWRRAAGWSPGRTAG